MSCPLLLFAQAAEKVAEKAAEKTGDPVALFISSPMPIILLMFVGFWFFILLPAQRKEKKQREMIMSGIKKNDEILTTSGFIGTVANVREGEDEITIKLDDNCKVRMKKSSIAQILKAKEAKPEDGKPAT
jgi:preprotein translocase subunit YajC